MLALNPCSPQDVAGMLAPCIAPGSRVVDVGCGRGDTLCWLARNTGLALYGVEPDAALHAQAQGNCPEAHIVRAGAEALPFPQGMFGAALMECVFSLTDDPTAAVGELARVIQANGALLVAELYARSDESIEIPHNPVLRNIYAKGPLEAFFLQCGQCSGNSLRPSEKLPSKQCLSARPPRPAKPDEPRFALLRFVDRTPDMRSLFAQMIMDGTGDVCFDTKTRKLLRQAKVGYGIWLFARA